jgi:hypothetical protein
MSILPKIAFPLPKVVSMLGVGTYAAKKIVDTIFMGATLWKVLLLIVACGSSISLGLLLVKRLTKAIGRTAAINW